jgi:hypothetical protein
MTSSSFIGHVRVFVHGAADAVAAVVGEHRLLGVWTVIESFAKTACGSEKEVSAVWSSP